MAIKWELAKFQKELQKKKQLDKRKVIATNIAEMNNRAETITPYRHGGLKESRRSTIKDDYGIFGYTIEYAPHVELGTKFQKGRHFLRRNFEIQQEKFKASLEEELKNDK